MKRIRVIPILTIDNNRLVKTIKFKKPRYIGDPINAVKILNDKEVDEIIFLDITASQNKNPPNYNLIEKISSECFMPLAYGGGISDFSVAKKIFNLGVEKIILNSALHRNVKLIKKVVENYGSQSIVACLDIKRNFFGKQYVYFENGRIKSKIAPEIFSLELESLGVGEIILNNIDREGTFMGYDLEMIKKVSNNVGVPVVACGGSRGLSDFLDAYNSGASAVSASSSFLFKNNNKDSILINYPTQKELILGFYSKI